MTLKPNTELQGGKYRIIRTIGQGGFGITYLAEQTMMERKVCIKEFFLKEFCDRDDQTSQVSLGTANARALMQKYQEKFLKEARMIAKLDHPSIIRIHDVFTENNTAYYVTDYIDGMNLNDMVKQRGPLPEDEALGYIHAVADGLSYVHANGINHLDVKPGNIMVRKADDRPILIDFGMSKQYDEGGDQTSSTPIGISEGYAPLEQYNIGGVSTFSPQTDIYSLAATLYRLVTGQVPPKASDVMNEGLPEMPSTISQTTRDAIEKAMQFRKKDRPESMAAFVALLGSVTMPATLSNFIEIAHDNDSEETMLSGLEIEDNSLLCLAEVVVNGRHGFIDKTGNMVIPCQYESIGVFSEGLAEVKLGEKYGFIDKTGQIVIPCLYEHSRSFSEGLAAVEMDGKWGFIDRIGRQVIPFKYDDAKSFSGGIAPVLVHKGLFSSQWAFINKEGIVTATTQHNQRFDIDPFFEKIAIIRYNNKIGFINETGTVITSCQFDSIGDLSEGLARVSAYGKFGLVDSNGKMVISCQFDYMGNFSEGLIEVWINDKVGFVNQVGKLVIPPQFDNAHGFSDGLAVVLVNGQYGFVDKSGRLAIPFQFKGFEGLNPEIDFSEGLAMVKFLDNSNWKWKCGYIDKTGKLVIAYRFDDAHHFSEGLAAVEIDDKWGYIDRLGQIAIPCFFDRAMDFSEGFAAVKVNGKWGFVDKTGTQIIPFQYDSAKEFVVRMW